MAPTAATVIPTASTSNDAPKRITPTAPTIAPIPNTAIAPAKARIPTAALVPYCDSKGN